MDANLWMNLCEKGIIHVLHGDFLMFANSKKMEILRNSRLYPNLFWKINFSCLKEVEVRWLNRWVKSLTPLFPCSPLTQKFLIPSSLASNVTCLVQQELLLQTHPYWICLLRLLVTSCTCKPPPQLLYQWHSLCSTQDPECATSQLHNPFAQVFVCFCVYIHIHT